MKRCENCGTECQDYAQICPRCGSRLPAVRQNMPGNPPGNMGGGAVRGTNPDGRMGGYQVPYYNNLPGRYDHTGEFPRDEAAKGKALAVLPYFLGLPGLLISSITQKSEYVQFHVRQQTRYTLLSTMINIVFAVLVGLISFFAGFGMPSYFSSELGGIWLFAHVLYGFGRTASACGVFITIQLLLQLAVFVLRMISAISTLAGRSKEAILVRYFL